MAGLSSVELLVWVPVEMSRNANAVDAAVAGGGSAAEYDSAVGSGQSAVGSRQRAYETRTRT